MSAFVIAFLAAGGGSVLGGIVTAVVTFRKERAQSVSILAEAQQVAQKTALDSASAAYSVVKAQCDECTARLDTVERKTEALIVAVETQLEDDTPQNRAAVRAAVWEARHAI